MKNLEFFKKIDFFYIILLLLTLISCYMFIGHSKNILYDWGREFCFPENILNGKLLYRDILNLFGPGAYMINALIYKLFGSDIKIHYILGYITSLSVVSCVYFTSKLFTDSFKSFIVALFSVAVGVATLNWSNCNYYFPYTYAILYGLISWFISVYFLVNSFKKPDKKFIYCIVSAVFAGVAVGMKYEFVISGIFFFFLMIFLYRKNIKQLLLVICSFLLIPAIELFMLLLRGVSFDCLKNALFIMKDIIKTPAYHSFYVIKGSIFDFNVFKLTIYDFLYAAAAILCLIIPFVFFKKNNKIAGFIFFPFSVVSSYCIICKMPVIEINYDGLLSFVPFLVIFCIIFNIKRLKPEVLIFSLLSVIISLKVLWSAQVQSYGNCFLPVLCISFFACVKSEKLKKAAVLYLLIVIFILTKQSITDLREYSFPVAGIKGKVYTEASVAVPANKLINYIMKNTDINDRVVIFPEIMTINYLTGRKNDYYFYGLQAPYVELFGIDAYISEYESSLPELFVINIVNDNAYQSGFYCDTYAYKLCELIKAKYNLQTEITGDSVDSVNNSYLVYKLKKNGE